MSKIIYIAGLGHSGSTLLDMSLGALKGVIGLGELKTIMDDTTREKHYASFCSCGNPANDCEVWKKIPGILKDKVTYPEKLEVILEFLKDKFGKDIVIVDSSKNSYPYLKYLNEKHDLKLVYLTRDIRSWSYSRHLATDKPIIYFILRWYLENVKLLRELNKMKIKAIKIGYEELSLYPEHLLRSLTAEIGLSYENRAVHPDTTKSHIISGNIARIDKEKRAKWTYDSRWLASLKVLFYSPLYFMFFAKNRKLVYSNVKKGSIKDFYLFGTNKKEEMKNKYN